MRKVPHRINSRARQKPESTEQYVPVYGFVVLCDKAAINYRSLPQGGEPATVRFSLAAAKRSCNADKPGSVADRAFMLFATG